MNREDQLYCGECGALIGSEPSFDRQRDGSVASDLGSDAAVFFSVLAGVAFAAPFVAALWGAGTANSRDQFDTYAYLGGLGAAPWAIAALVAFGLAGARAKTLLE